MHTLDGNSLKLHSFMKFLNLYELKISFEYVLTQKENGEKFTELIDFNKVNYKFSNMSMTPININFYDNVILSRQQSHEFNFIKFIQEEILESFLNVKSNGVGHDGMHPKFIIITLSYTLTYFPHLFNTIVTISTLPSMWKHVKIVPII